MPLFFGKVADTSLTCTTNVMFPRYLFFIFFFKVSKKNFVVFNEICHAYSTVQQLVNITIIINSLLFLFYTLYISNL